MKWTEFTEGEVISPSFEIARLKTGQKKEDQLIKFIILNGKLCDFPDTLLPMDYEGVDKLEFEKLFSVKFD